MAGNPLMNMLNGNNPMMNNPLMQMVNMMKNGGNPSAMLNQLIQKNPQMQQISQMMNGKSPQQMGEMMRNLAQQKGVDLGQLMGQIGVPEDVQAKYLGNTEQQQKYNE